MAFTIKTGDTSPILQATFTDASGSAVSIVGATVKLIVADLSNTVVMTLGVSTAGCVNPGI